MTNYEIFALKALRRVYAKVFAPKPEPYDRGVEDFDEASDMIYRLLASGRPCMVARFGSTELFALTNYLGVSAPSHSVWNYIRGKQFAWWWDENVKDQMTRWSGFFPSTEENLTRFGAMMVEDSREVDILGSWLRSELIMKAAFGLDFKKVVLVSLEPYWAKNPWSRVLEGKRVLVIHPFASLVEEQYRTKRTQLFKDPRVLPEFELKTIQAVQSLGGSSEFPSWFAALDSMKAQMDATDYDIALIGCGAYGFPLAAHAKRTGHQAVHLGGALQLLFGIRGKRWDNPDYGIQEFGRQNAYKTLFNDNWVYPSADMMPANARQVEGACYWK